MKNQTLSRLQGLAQRMQTVITEAAGRDLIPPQRAELASVSTELVGLGDEIPESDQARHAYDETISALADGDHKTANAYLGELARLQKVHLQTREVDAVRKQFGRLFDQDDKRERTNMNPYISDYPATRALFSGTEYGRTWDLGELDEVRTVQTSTGGSAFYTIEFGDSFFGNIARQSVVLNTNPLPRTFLIDATELRLAAGTANQTAAWVAEGGTASAADEGVSSVRIVPEKLMRYMVVSNEVLDDANFEALEPLANELFKGFGQAIDNAAYGTAGSTSGGVTALLTNCGAGTVSNSNAAITSLDPFVSTMGSALAAANDPGDLVWVSGASVWTHIGQVHVSGTASNADVRPLLIGSYSTGGAAIAGEILGRPQYITSSTGMAGGTAADAILYAPQELAIVYSRRYSVLFDRTTRADSDETRIIATMRIGVKPIHTKGFARLSNVDTT